MSVPHDRDRLYSMDEIVELLEKAERMGFSLEKGSELEQMTVADLDRLVNGSAA